MAEKKIRKQIRQQIVNKQQPDDKKTFLKEIQNELVKLAKEPGAMPKTKKNAKS